MRILFDHGMPSGIASSLAPHEVVEARERGRDRISNGQLLTAAEAAGFDLLLTTDKRIRYQQNLSSRKIAVVVLGNSVWRIVRLHLDRIVDCSEPGYTGELCGSRDTVSVDRFWSCSPKSETA